MNRDATNLIWVDSSFDGDSSGSFDAPFSSLQEALRFTEPGMVVNIKPATYSEAITIEVSGTITDPVRICGYTKDGGTVVFSEGWFMYDTSDVIVENISFKNTESHAIAVIGNCERNSFRNILFDGCGEKSESACSLYFGGSGSSANVVEACEFISGSDTARTVALMVASGDPSVKNGANRNFLIRKNIFNNYYIGIAMGTESPEKRLNDSYSHVIENNNLIDCRQSAIVLRVGDTTVVNNVIKGGHFGVDAIFSPESRIVDNRIEECNIAISVSSKELFISDNTFINSLMNHVILNVGVDEKFSGVEIGGNSFIRTLSNEHSDIDIKNCNSAVLRDNIFYGGRDVSTISSDSNQNFFVGNISTDEYGDLSGVEKTTVTFEDKADSNFGTDLEVGSSGRSVSKRILDFSIEELSKEQIDMLKKHGVDQSRFNEKFTKDLYVNSLFSDEEENLDEENSDFTDRRDIGDDGLVDFSTWD